VAIPRSRLSDGKLNGTFHRADGSTFHVDRYF